MSQLLTSKLHDASVEAPNRAETTVSVGGMTCAACVARVEKVLRTVEGVTTVAVNYGTEQATVTHSAETVTFEQLQAAGWMYDESTAQVSMNLLDYSVTGLHHVTEAIREEAHKIGLNVVAGELVGLVPLDAMISAGRNYHNEPDSAGVSSLVNAAISGLMLDKLGKFEPESSIIEWAISEAFG